MSDTAPPAPEEKRSGILQIVKDVLSIDRQALIILVAVPFVLTLLDYYGLPWHYRRYVEDQTHVLSRRVHNVNQRADPPLSETLDGLTLPGDPAMRHYLWWGIACLVLLVIVPTLVAAMVRLSPRDIGLRLKGTGRDAWTYLILFLIFLPVIWMVSQRPEFRQTYPFYKPTKVPLLQGRWPFVRDKDFLVFELIYCAQFFAIEYFFRGFLVLGLKKSLGIASVLVMLAPYCMIHFYKPMPEALGAIGAGLVLGVLAWRTGTIIYGWFLHYAVALSMDLLALYQGERLF